MHQHRDRNGDRGQEFAELVHRIVVIEKRGAADQIAGALGLSYDALYARLRNRVKFSADEIQRLIATVPDFRIAAWILRDTRFIAADRGGLDDPELPVTESLRHSVLHMLIEASEAASQVERALDDGRVDHREAAQIAADIEAAERAIATLRAHVEQFSG